MSARRYTPNPHTQEGAAYIRCQERAKRQVETIAALRAELAEANETIRLRGPVAEERNRLREDCATMSVALSAAKAENERLAKERDTWKLAAGGEAEIGKRIEAARESDLTALRELLRRWLAMDPLAREPAALIADTRAAIGDEK